MNVPRLRFSEFSGEWEEKRLGQLANLTSSKRVFLSDYVASGVPFFRGKEISELENGEVPSDILFISREAFELYREKHGVPSSGDILITAVGTLANVFRVKEGQEFYFKDGNLIWLRNISENTEFLEISLRFHKPLILRSSIGSSQKALTIVELNKLQFAFPSLPEQKKIAAFLGVVDAKIAALRARRDGLERYKRGLMQALFSQTLRFTESDGSSFPDWEEKQLGELCIPKQWPTISVKQNTQANFPVYGANGLIGFSDTFTHAAPTIAVGCRGVCGSVHLTQPKSYITGNSMALDDLEIEKVDLYFLYFLLCHFGFRAITSGSAQPQITGKAIKAYQMLLPHPDEQAKIADALSAMDAKIAAVTQQLDHMQTFKKGLLKQMFV